MKKKEIEYDYENPVQVQIDTVVYPEKGQTCNVFDGNYRRDFSKLGDDNAKRYVQQLGDDAYNNGYQDGRGSGFKTGAAAASIVILAGGLIFRGFKKLRNRSKDKDKADA